MKKSVYLTASLFFLVMTVVFGIGHAQPSVKKIGLLLWANEVRYEDALQGFIDELKDEGYAPPGVELIVRRAQGSKVQAKKIAGEFAALNLDLYYSAGTSGTSLMAKAIKDAPIVFSTVYDPIESGLVEGWTSSRNNLTGSSNNMPLSKVLELALRIVPVKSIAVLYTPHEKNSEAQLKSLLAAQASLGITVIPVAIVSEAEVASTLPFVEGKAQAIYVTGSIVIGKVIQDIVDFAAKNKILTVTHLQDLVEKGVMVGFCAENHEQGRVAGKLAVKILNGAKPMDLPIEKSLVFSIWINQKSAQAAGITIPQDIIRKAVKVF